MKKVLSSILLFILLASPAGATLYSYYKGNLPSIASRAQVAAQYGIFNYTGSLEQNLKLEAALRAGEGDSLGFNVVTDYKTTLSSSISGSDTSIPVASVTTKDGHVIVIDDLGGQVFLSIEPGGAREEIVKCTGISSTTWTGCTRGLAFYGTSVSAVPANQKAHNAGAAVIMSNVQYTIKQFVDKDSDETVGGRKTFTLAPIVTSAPTTTTQLANKQYVDSVGAGGFTSGNIGDGKTLRANPGSPTTVDVNTSTPAIAPSFLIENGTFNVSTSTGSRIDNQISNRMNSTSTAPGPLTIGGNFKVNGNATSTGSLQFGNSFCDSFNVCTNNLSLKQTTSGTVGNITADPSLSSYVQSYSTTTLAFMPDELLLNGLCTGSGAGNNIFYGNVSYINGTPKYDAPAIGFLLNNGVTALTLVPADQTTFSCGWTGGTASTSVKFLSTGGFVLKLGSSEGGTFDGSATLSSIGYQAVKYGL